MTLLSKRNLVRLAMAGAVAIGTPVAVAGTANAAPAPTNTWDQLAQCESSGNWGANTGNGFSGGLQFTPSTWQAFGGTGSAHNASREQQIAVAERVLAAQGWGAWPACSKKLGLSGTPAKQQTAAQPVQQRAAAPAPKKQAAPTWAAQKPAAQPRAAGGPTYTVVAGDTLSKIAAKHGTTWQTLYAKNRGVVSNPNMIFVGQTLQVG